MLSTRFDINKMFANASFLNVIFKTVFFYDEYITLISRYQFTPDEFKTANIIIAT